MTPQRLARTCSPPHVFDAAEPFRHADEAGWYNSTYRRTSDGWRLASVSLTVRYVAGEPIGSMAPRSAEASHA